jgi:hypothetical protein
MNVYGGSGCVASCNAGHGIFSAGGSGFACGGGYTWKNGGWGALASENSYVNCSLDFGVGGGNANGSGSILAQFASNGIITGSANWAPSSPPFGTIGNVNSIVTG